MKISDWLYERTKGWFILACVTTVLVGTVIGAMGMALDVSPGSGLTEYLTAQGQAKMPRAWIEIPGWWWLAFLFFAVDALLFAPAFGIVLIGVAGGLRELSRSSRSTRWIGLIAGVAIVVAAVAVMTDEIENIAALAALTGVYSAPQAFFNAVTGAKLAFYMGAMVLVSVLVLLWFFGAGESDATGDERTRLRRHVSDIVWRNRYNLLGLVVLAGLILVMDQSRDVLVGIAQAWDEDRVWMAVVIVMSWLALWALAHTCWTWCRIMCRLARPRVAGHVEPPAQQGVFLFVRWFARLLGATPVIMLMWLCGLSARDAARSNAWTTSTVLIMFGVLALLGALLFLWSRVRGRRLDPHEYYEAVSGGDAAADELVDKRYDFLWLPASPLTLPIVAMIALTAVRWLDLHAPNAPPLSFVVICLSMTLWVGVAGYLAQVSLRHGRPYVVMLLIVIAVLGVIGATDNHVVWTPFPPGDGAGSLKAMWTYHAWLTGVLIAGACVAYLAAARKTPLRGSAFTGLDAVERTRKFWPLRLQNMALAGIATLACALGVLYLADRDLARSLTEVTAKQTKDHEDREKERPDVRTALTHWLVALCAGGRCDGKSGPYGVYFVSSEGGGIRAAYWTALALAELSLRVPDFDRRTFSVSGVSGGSVGAAIYRACRSTSVDAKATLACVQKSQGINLLTPLLSAFMFEDVMARVIPTGWCTTPGCGVMSRGAWFEQALEVNLPELRKPLVASRPTDRHLPYLFLNSTWVETGERAIASEVRIESTRFPTARDQLFIARQDLPTSTAAHNSARFPYVNAIGSFRTPASKCPMLKSDEEKAKMKPLVCGHLADGGYFDNSGGHTTADILRALGALLREDGSGALGKAQKEWLRANLVPQVIMIRNGVEEKTQLDCDPQEPSGPRCKSRFPLLTDFLGPPLTAFNTIGTGANGRVAESLLRHEALAVRPPAHQALSEPVATVDLTREGVLYPLGWYLSLSAQCGMERQARRDDRYYALYCRKGDEDCGKKLRWPVPSEPRKVCSALDNLASTSSAATPSAPAK